MSPLFTGSMSGNAVLSEIRPFSVKTDGVVMFHWWGFVQRSIWTIKIMTLSKCNHQKTNKKSQTSFTLLDFFCFQKLKDWLHVYSHQKRIKVEHLGTLHPIRTILWGLCLDMRKPRSRGLFCSTGTTLRLYTVMKVCHTHTHTHSGAPTATK